MLKVFFYYKFQEHLIYFEFFETSVKRCFLIYSLNFTNFLLTATFKNGCFFALFI